MPAPSISSRIAHPRFSHPKVHLGGHRVKTVLFHFAGILGVLYASAGAALPMPTVLVDVPTQRLLSATAPDTPWYPASLTKVMTLHLTFEALQNGKLTEDAALPVSKHAAAQPPTRLGLRAGGTIPLAQAVKAVATISSNDAAVVLAEAVAGSEPAFVDLMNKRARDLGLTRTRFGNASGLPGGAQWTTARDMAKLAIATLRRFPARSAVFSTRQLRHAGRTRTTHNGPLTYTAGSDGMKTGFTCDAGYNIILTAVRDGRRVLAVVLGAGSRTGRNQRATALIASGFKGDRSGAKLPKLRAPVPRLATNVSPPKRLKPGTCGRNAAPSSRWVRDHRRLKGWGVFLGNYAKEDAAKSQLKRALAALKGRDRAPRRPQQGVLPRGTPERRSWKAVLGGLSQPQAGAACKALTQAGIVCIAHSPARLAMGGYPNQ